MDNEHIIVKGSYEAKEWIIKYFHPYDLPPVIGHIYDFVIYRKIVNTCSDEDLYNMEKLINRFGFRDGIRRGLNNLRIELIRQEAEKRRLVEKLSDSNDFIEQYKQKQFENEMKESMLEASSQVDVVKRNSYYNNGSIHNIPESILLAQPVLKEGKYKGVVDYKVFDKIYNCWSAEIKAPHIPDMIVRKAELAELERWLDTLLEMQLISSTKARMEYEVQRIRAKKEIKQVEDGAKEQVKEIKKILGVNDSDDLNSPNIF